MYILSMTSLCSSQSFEEILRETREGEESVYGRTESGGGISSFFDSREIAQDVHKLTTSSILAPQHSGQVSGASKSTESASNFSFFSGVLSCSIVKLGKLIVEEGEYAQSRRTWSPSIIADVRTTFCRFHRNREGENGDTYQ